VGRGGAGSTRIAPEEEGGNLVQAGLTDAKGVLLLLLLSTSPGEKALVG